MEYQGLPNGQYPFWGINNNPIDELTPGSNSDIINPMDIGENPPGFCSETSYTQTASLWPPQGILPEYPMPSQGSTPPNDSNSYMRISAPEDPSLNTTPPNSGGSFPVPDASPIDYSLQPSYHNCPQGTSLYSITTSSTDPLNQRITEPDILFTVEPWQLSKPPFDEKITPPHNTSPTLYSNQDFSQADPQNCTAQTNYIPTVIGPDSVDKGKKRAIESTISSTTSWHQTDPTLHDRLRLQSRDPMSRSMILASFMWNRLQNGETRHEPTEEDYQKLASMFHHSAEELKQSFEEYFCSTDIHDPAGVETQDKQLKRQSQNKVNGKRKRTEGSRSSSDMSTSTRSGLDSVNVRQMEGYEIRNKRAVHAYKKKQRHKKCRVNGKSKCEKPQLLPCLSRKDCNASFIKRKRASWMKHSQRTNSENFWVCPGCKDEDGVFVAVRRNRLKKHIEKEHKNKAAEIENKAGDKKQNWKQYLESKQVAVKGDREEWRCYFCSRTFSSRRDWGNHVTSEFEDNNYTKDDWFRRKREWSRKKKQQHSERNGKRRRHTTHDFDPDASDSGNSESDSDTDSDSGCNPDSDSGITSDSDSDSDSEGPSSGSKRHSGSRGAKRENTEPKQGTKRARKDNGEGSSRSAGIRKACEVERLSDNFACNFNIDATEQNHHSWRSRERAKTTTENLYPQGLSFALAGISAWVDEYELELRTLDESFFNEVEVAVGLEDTSDNTSLDSIPGYADTDTPSERSGQLGTCSVPGTAADSKITERCRKLVHVCKEHRHGGKQTHHQHHDGQRTGGQAACSMDVIRISLVISSDKKLLSIFRKHRQHSVLDESSMFPIPQRFFIQIFARCGSRAEQQILKSQGRYPLAKELTQAMGLQKKQECNAATAQAMPLHGSFESTIRFSNPLTMLKTHWDRIPPAQVLVCKRWISGLKVFSPNLYDLSD